jgi:hypothetical protein
LCIPHQLCDAHYELKTCTSGLNINAKARYVLAVLISRH